MNLLFLLLMFPGIILATEEPCENPVADTMATAKELANDVKKVPVATISQSFCKALEACEGNKNSSFEQYEIQQMENYYKHLPESIQSIKEEIAKWQEKLKTAKDSGWADEYKSEIKYNESSLAEYELDYKKYQDHLKDPQNIPHPMKEKGIGLTPEEQLVYAEKQEIAEYEEHLKNLPDQISEYKDSIEEYKKNLAEFKDIAYIEYYKKIIKQEEKKLAGLESEFKKYQDYQKDPKKYSHPMKDKGLGLTKEEKKQFQIKENEKSFLHAFKEIESLKADLENAKTELANLKKSNGNKSVIEDLEQMLKVQNNYLAKRQKSYQMYLDHKKNPKLKPDFLTHDFEYYLSSGEAEVNYPQGCERPYQMYKEVVETLSYREVGTCGLNPEELIAMKFYSEHGYGCMNSYLRGSDKKNTDLNYLVQVLNNGLDKLPSYEGVVRRGADLPGNIRDLHKEGSIVNYEAYTSTSTSHGFGGSDKFLIFSSSGKPIMGFSSAEGEDEVLFKSGTKFKVLSNTNNGDEYTYILKEVSVGMTKQQEEEADKKILEAVKSKSESDKGDTWRCPKDEKTTIPKLLKQGKMK